MIADLALTEAKIALRRHLKRLATKLAIRFGAGAAGAVFLAVGSAFVLFASVRLLAMYTQSWIAWGMVGIVALAVGGSMLWSVKNQLIPKSMHLDGPLAARRPMAEKLRPRDS